MTHWMSLSVVCTVLLVAGCASEQPFSGQTFASAGGQTSGARQAGYQAPEPELVDVLTGQLGVNSRQAMGGVGSIFSLAQQRMNPSDFMRLSSYVPDMDQYLSAVPQSTSSNSLFGLAAGLMGEQTNGLGSLAVLAGSFQTLGMDANMIGQFVPVVLQYIQGQSGPAAMNLLQNALY
ncbi:DUF2780 domain-containing protein [Methylomonas sp. LL1]|uniref:DUF2780 domain-containing protein n=1 Tax=Methylomonas sp. LL1 TaxID=2785785 RepID=UPI0018C4455B|nr:DUF2780 domain-containing protein [Methylomonas sp. LL1]QPK61702.1 DUF2780 domain-containing protein [Methylomonas sp. LL1]